MITKIEDEKIIGNFIKISWNEEYLFLLIKTTAKKEEDKKSKLDPSKPISLDFLTNPNKEWVQKIKMSV